jgi:acyl-homoserine lactone acylase PvdQ
MPSQSTKIMKSLNLVFLLLSSLWVTAQSFRADEIARWKTQAQGIRITRDKWDIPHVYGKTDADAIFGMLYVQCEDDFVRVEDNYITNLGRMAEVEGEAYLYQDLRARLFLDTNRVKAIYQTCPTWMKKLLHAFADGCNYYLYTHPEVKPRLIKRFEPWMPLMFSEGSIGGNISAISVERLKNFYTKNQSTSWIKTEREAREWEPLGSNGFAIAPSKSATGNALLLINPHTTFYFRSELHIRSEEGLNVYGAVTWGQFFIYQGFNENCGWMHTSSAADVLDEYIENIEWKEGKAFYRHGSIQKPLRVEKVKLWYKEGEALKQKEFDTYHTHHGPIIGEQEGKWVSLSMMNEPYKALAQSFLRTKAKGYKQYNKAMDWRGNASNNTVFADRQGNIAYWHGNFMPRRNPSFDWQKPVDGSNPATDWQGLHPVKETVQLLNPGTGWLQNCNSTPYTAAAAQSPDPKKYPSYMAPDPENYRGVHAVRVLKDATNFTLDKLIAAAYDPQLPGFEAIVPSLVQAYTQSSAKNPRLDEAIELLRRWDYRYSLESVASTLAIYWGEKMLTHTRYHLPAEEPNDALSLSEHIVNSSSAAEKIKQLELVLDELTRDFGTWKTGWGEINRFQRLTGKIRETFDDQKPSFPVAFTSSHWGSLAAFGARTYPGTKRRYGSVGNSFVAVVEFGPRLKAKSIVTGGQSSNPNSPHFNDQSKMYTEGKFKEVLFYPEEYQQGANRTYRPGE